MIFTLCEHLREQIADINDTVLERYNKITREREQEEADIKAKGFTTNVDHLTYTPVNAETFKIWSD